MVSFMHFWKRLASAALAMALLAGCEAIEQQAPGALQVRAARIVAASAGPRLELDLDCRLNGPMMDALEHGIPITLRVDLRAQSDSAVLRDQRRIELRYFPLTRRYQLRDHREGDVQSFPASAYLIDALASLKLSLPQAFAQLPAGSALSLDVALDKTALPGALRLPALIEPAWRLAAPEFTWTVAAG